MHFFKAALLLFPLGALAQQNQINFYYDDDCQDYAGSAYPAPFEVAGGPYGSQSMLWVTWDYSICPSDPIELLFCKNAECNAYDVAGFTMGVCKHFENGVWAEEICT